MMGKSILVLLVCCAFPFLAIDGRQVLLRPVSAAMVRRMLKDTDREDAIPEGRIISHGLAAVNGFALGFKKGVIGIAIADSIAALAGSSSSNSSNGNKPSVSYNGTTNELCFTSRSARSDIVGTGDAEEERVLLLGTSAAAGTTPTTATTGTAAPTSTNVATNEQTGTGTGTNTASQTSTMTQTDGSTTNCIVIRKT